MAVAQGTKPAKKAAAPKKTKTAPSHPLYIEMIKEALVSLKERTGSSAIAIAKHIEEQQKVRDLPPNFRKRLAVQLKKFVASGKLIKVKNSFKLPSSSTTATKKSPPATTTESKPKPKSSQTGLKKKKATVTSKPKTAKVAKSPVKKVAAKRVAKSPVKKVAAKKVAAAAKVKKLKSIKSPVKKAPVAKKAKK